MTKRTAIAVAAVIALAGSAQAQEVGSASVGGGITTFGLSLEGDYRITPEVAARGMLMGGFSYDDTLDIDEYTVDGELQVGGIAALVDYYPLLNSWRISGGILLSNTELTGDFVGPQSFTGEIALASDVAPMITTGFKTEIAPGWSFSGDIGIVISSLEASSDSADPLVQDEIDTLNADLEDVPVLPFAGIAVSYSF